MKTKAFFVRNFVKNLKLEIFYENMKIYFGNNVILLKNDL